MDQKQMTKQIMDFNKTAFDNTFNSVSILQDQAEKLIYRFLEKAPWFPEDGKKVINEWVKTYKKGREDFKAYADENYKKAMEYFAKAEEAAHKIDKQ